MLFSTINNILISVNRSNFTLVFYKADYHTNLGAEKNEQNLVHIFQDTYSKSS